MTGFSHYTFDYILSDIAAVVAVVVVADTAFVVIGLKDVVAVVAVVIAIAVVVGIILIKAGFAIL